jgi:pimeloyl-ACP methyl ester carboxylesterase
MNFADKSPALILAEQGYDVWLGNNRGNKYSRKHVHLDPDWDDSFWYFDFEQMGTYDLPANIDYIQKFTGAKKVAMGAHSQGTTQTFWALTQNEAYYKENLSLFAAFAPVTRVKHCKSTLLDLIAWNVDLI